MRAPWLLVAVLVALFLPRVVFAQASSLTIDWEASGDDGDVGVLDHYEMRYRNTPVVGTDTTGWWNAATVVANLPAPTTPLTTQSVTINAAFAAGATYYFIMRACDEASNCSAYSNIATRTIATDAQPVVNNPGNKTVNELATLAFQASATDADAGTVLTWSLDAGSPAGAIIGASAGTFSWTPTEAQGPGTYPVTIRATDDWVPPSSGIAVFSIVVNEINLTPVLTSPGNMTVNELVNLSFTLGVIDADLPANTITKSMDSGFPAGATINPATGAFSWTPSEAQGPGSFPITFRATDNGIPNLSSSASITVQVNEINTAPAVANPGNKTVNELANLSFIAVANDVDFPSNTLTWSVDGGGPQGSTMNSSSGAFSWTPAAGQIGTFPVTIRAADNGTPGLSGTAAFTITVVSINQAPVVTNPGNETIDEFSTLTVPMTASDADIPPDTMTWTIDAGGQPGAQIIPGSLGSATFSWTPLEVDGPGNYIFTVRVTDNAANPASGSTTFNVTVNEVNSPPAFTALGQPISSAISVTVGVPYHFTFLATDTDFPANTLKYFLNAPLTGASIDSITGAFSFTAATAGTFTAQAKVRDNGSPALTKFGKTLVFTATGGAAPDTMNPAKVTSFVNVSGLSYSAVAPTKNEDGPCPGGTNGTALTDLMELRVYAHFTPDPPDSHVLLTAFQSTAGQTVPIDVFIAAGKTGTIWPVAVDSVGNESCIGPTLSFSIPVPPAGLLGQYFDNMNFTGSEVDRFDPKIFFAWDMASPIAGIAPDTWSARWTGYVTPQYSETYIIYATSDDGMRVYINNVLIANGYSDHPVKEYNGFVDLLAGHQYAIKVEYYDNIQRALAKLFWSSHSVMKQIVPASALSH